MECLFIKMPLELFSCLPVILGRDANGVITFFENDKRILRTIKSSVTDFTLQEQWPSHRALILRKAHRVLSFTYHLLQAKSWRCRGRNMNQFQQQYGSMKGFSFCSLQGGNPKGPLGNVVGPCALIAKKQNQT